MYYSQRTLLRIVTVFFLLVSALFWLQALKKDADYQPEVGDFVCTTKTISNIVPKGITVTGDIVIDFKMQRITLHYDVRQQTNKHTMFYRDIYLKDLRRVSNDLFTFAVASVTTFPNDNSGDLFSYFRLLHPDAKYELRIQPIGEILYLFSLNRQIYNVCIAS